MRFAALLHDLGKGVTPSATWPAHHGHEGLGVQLVKDVSARLKVPTECRDLAVLAAREHGNVHRSGELKAQWEREKKDVTAVKDLRERLERVRLDSEAAERKGDLVVDRHRGDLTFESVAGRGTTWFLRLPLHGAGTEARPEPAQRGAVA